MDNDPARLIATWFLYFVFYSICGYFLEIIHTATNRGVWENRGFLFGPYCPIYGIGALILIFTTNHLSINPLMVFAMAVFVCTTIEYLTAIILERIFKMRWWDYSKFAFNFQGRICLKNSILFGFGGLVIIYITQPSVANLLANLGTSTLVLTSVVVSVIMFIDFILSSIANYNISDLINTNLNVSAQQIKAAAIRFYYHPRKRTSSISTNASTSPQQPQNPQNHPIPPQNPKN